MSAHLEDAAAIQCGIVVLEIYVRQVATHAVAVDAAALAAERLQRAVLGEDAAGDGAGQVVLVQPTTQICYLPNGCTA